MIEDAGEEITTIEDADDEIKIEAYCKTQYQNVFWPPANENWRIDASYPDGYYYASKHIVEGVLSGQLREAIEGVSALFLFRHYLELRLKLLIFHARWLRDWNSNAHDDEIKAVQKTHPLEDLWTEAQRECKARIPKELWRSFDIEFVEKCIKEFHSIDPTGERFRYPVDRIQVDKTRPLEYPLGISFSSLYLAMQHAYSVLEWIDSYLLNKHGENEEWDDILNSY